MTEQHTEHLRVDPQIVSLLSKSTYQKSFPSAIRELVSNAYDADALSVKIDFDGTYSLIEILDDGNGMTFDEFKRYLRIAGKKQEGQLTRKYKRKRIGNFGVGFLSVFPFCDSLQIITTTENSNYLLTATIPTKDFFSSNKSKKKDSLEINVEDIPINVIISQNPKEKFEHYTKIRLINPTWLVEQYFITPKTKKKDSIFGWEPIPRFIWELQEDLPISLKDNSKYYSEYKYNEPIGINVKVNGKDLFRNDYLDIIITEGEINLLGIICKYIFTTNYETTIPYESRGIKLRVNNVGIGKRTDFNLKRDRGFSRLHWISGEIFFSEEIKEHLNISRDDFISNSTTEEIFDFFAEKLRNAAMEVEAVSIVEQRFDNKISKEANKSKKEIVESDLKRLENRGYQIVYNQNDDSTSINKNEKKVFVSKMDLEDIETIDLLGKTYEIRYDRWEVTGERAACKREGKNIFIINQNYPLFKSKSAGDIFKKIHILILIGEEKSNSSQQLSDFLQKKMLEVFNT